MSKGRNLVITLGDRRNSGFCLKCGTGLIPPYNDYQCCSSCTKEIMEAITELKHKSKAKKGKVGGKLVDRRAILRQVVPIGKPIK